MTEIEIKPSFTGRYIILTIITSLIIAGISLGIDKISKAKPKRELVVYEGSLIDVINRESFLNSQIQADYYLSGSPEKKIKSLFRKTVTIKNVGNEGVENLSVVFSVKDNDAILVNNPIVESRPESIFDALGLSKNDKTSSNNVHMWNVPLLNQGESLTFEYTIYSEKKLTGISFSTVPRKKDWDVSRENILASKTTRELFSSFFGGMFTLVIALPLGLLIFTRLMRPVYRKEWDRNPEIREKYESYDQYFYKHFPPPIVRYFQ